MDQVKIKRLNQLAQLPRRATGGSAGYDLCAALEQELALAPGERAKVPTGLAMEIGDPAVVGLVYARSGLAVKHGIAPANCVGVIDSDYRGELLVPLQNNSREEYRVQPGERIAQLIFAPVLLPELIEAGSLAETERGEGGFGSTGKVGGKC